MKPAFSTLATAALLGLGTFLLGGLYATQSGMGAVFGTQIGMSANLMAMLGSDSDDDSDSDVSSSSDDDSDDSESGWVDAHLDTSNAQRYVDDSMADVE